MSTPVAPNQEFISQSEYREMLEAQESAIGPGDTQRVLNRSAVSRGILEAFEMVGGVPRLAVWANEEGNYGDFVKIWARLAPNANYDNGDGGETKVIHVIPRTALDE